MRRSVQDDRGSITRALMGISVWGMEAWRQSSLTEREFQDKIAELWVNYHRLEQAISRNCIADIIGGVRGIIPHSHLATYGDCRYDVEKEDPFQPVNYEISSETSYSSSAKLDDVCAANFSHITPVRNQSLFCKKGNEPTPADEAVSEDLCFHPIVNKIMDDFESHQAKPRDHEFTFDRIEELQNIFVQLRSLSVRCERVKLKWFDHLLNTSSRFLKAAVLNPSLYSDLKAGVPLSINYEQLFCESISLPELWSIPQPPLERNDGLDSKDVRRLWAKVSSPGVRAQWKPPEETSIFGSLPSPITSTLGCSDSVTLLTSHLLRKDEIMDLKMQSDSEEEVPDTEEIEEKRVRELLGSLLDLMEDDDKPADEANTEVEEEGHSEPDTSSLSKKAECGDIDHPSDFSFPQANEFRKDEVLLSKSKNKQSGSSISLSCGLSGNPLLKSQEKNVHYITQNWLQSQLQASQQNLRLCAEEQTHLVPLGFLETTYTTVTTTKKHSLIGMNLPVTNVRNVYGHGIFPHHSRRHAVPPVIDFPSQDLGNFSSVPLSPAFHMPRFFQSNQQRNVLAAGPGEYDSWMVPSYALGKVAFPFSANTVFKNSCHPRDAKGFSDTPDVIEPRRIQGKLAAKPDTSFYLEPKKNRERQFRIRSTDYTDKIRPSREIYVPPHARDGRYAASSNQNQPHVDFDTWLLHRSCSGKVLSPISLSNSQCGLKNELPAGKCVQSSSELERYETSHLQCSSVQTHASDDSGITENRIPYLTQRNFECDVQNHNLISSEKHPPPNNGGFRVASCPYQVQSLRRFPRILPTGGFETTKQYDPLKRLLRNQGENLSSEVYEISKAESRCGKSMSSNTSHSEQLEKDDLTGRAGAFLCSSFKCPSSLCEPCAAGSGRRLVDTGVQASFLSELPPLLSSSEANVHFGATDSREARQENNEVPDYQQIPVRHRKRKKKSRGNFQKYQNGGNDIHAKDGRYTRKMLQQRRAKYSNSAPGHFQKGSQGGKISHESFCRHKHPTSALVKSKIVASKVTTPTIKHKDVTMDSSKTSRNPNIVLSAFHPFHAGSFRPSYSAVVEKGHAIYAECAEHAKSKTERGQEDSSNDSCNTKHKSVNPCDLPRVLDSELQPGVLPREIENAILKLIEKSKLDRISKSHSATVQMSSERNFQMEPVSKSKPEATDESTAFDNTTGRTSDAMSPDGKDPKENDNHSDYQDDEEYLSISDVSSSEMFSCGANEGTESGILDSTEYATSSHFGEEGHNSLSGDISMTDFEDWSETDSLFPKDPIELLRVSKVSSIANSLADLDEMENLSFRSVSPDVEYDNISCVGSFPSFCFQRRNQSNLGRKHVVTSTPMPKANSVSELLTSNSPVFLNQNVTPTETPSSLSYLQSSEFCYSVQSSTCQRVADNMRQVELPFSISDDLGNSLHSNPRRGMGKGTSNTKGKNLTLHTFSQTKYVNPTQLNPSNAPLSERELFLDA